MIVRNSAPMVQHNHCYSCAIGPSPSVVFSIVLQLSIFAVSSITGLCVFYVVFCV